MSHHLATSIAAARNTLLAEAKALMQLAETLPQATAFEETLKTLLELEKRGGRVIVTGVGKSGHIGGKIAATLASTGTPAFFVHPAEALHGDLGMITNQDVVLALSHSGESKELAAILTYCTRFSIPLIALTGRKSAEKGSSLARAATHILNTQVETEACPLNLAPTTSTTAALALADALAVALMTARGFAETDFAVFHPGGKLGAQLLRVSEVMIAQNLPLCLQSAPMAEVLVELTRSNLASVGLTDETGALVGIFTDGDLKRRLLNASESHTNLLTQSAQSVMTPNPRTVDENALAAAGVAQMQQQNVKALWVVNNARKPVGLFRLEECLTRGVV